MDERIARYISEAEKSIESREYAGALEALAAAENIDPENKSVQMIRDLVKSLQSEFQSTKRRPLTLTIDAKPAAHPNPEQLTEVQKRIRSLTSNADYLLSRGSIDGAFESLMRAYLLDPTAPEVLACEQRILPAYRQIHGTGDGEGSVDLKFDFGARKPKVTSSLFDRLRSGKFLK